uniref:Uncharacterized protein n=1 Tax=Tetranychus urticae TaxID=32264 RepID=T1KVI3_TETUR
MFFLIVIVFLLSDSTVALNTCNDECLSKTYCISRDGTSVCSKDNRFSAVFTMDQVEDKLYFSLTLTEYQIVPNKTHHGFGLILSSGSSTTTYYCKLHTHEPRSFVWQNNQQKAGGTSQYTNNNLQCNWKATKTSNNWPLFRIDDNYIIVSKYISLTLKYDDLNYGPRSVVLANDTSELPFYRLQSLKCCNKVRESHGPYVTSVRELFNTRIDESSCSWTTPICLSYYTNQLELLAGSFDLKVTSGNVVLYAERNVQFERIAEVSPRDDALLLGLFEEHKLSVNSESTMAGSEHKHRKSKILADHIDFVMDDETVAYG